MDSYPPWSVPGHGRPAFADFKLLDSPTMLSEWSLGPHKTRRSVSLGGSHPSLLGPKQTLASRNSEGMLSSVGSWTGAQPTVLLSGEGEEPHLSTAAREVFWVLQPQFKWWLLSRPQA